MVNTNEFKPILQAVDGLVDTSQALRAGRAASGAKERFAASKISQNNSKSLSQEQANAMRALEAEQKLYSPGIAEKTVGFAGSVSGLVGMVSLFGLGAVNMLGKGVAFIGKIPGLSKLKDLGEKISAPAEWLNKNDFSALGSRLNISEPAQKISKSAANGMAWAAEKTGAQIIGDRFEARNIGKAYRHLTSARRNASAINLSGIPANFKDDIASLHEHFVNAKNIGDIPVHFEEIAKANEITGSAAATAVINKTEATVVTLGKKIENAKAALEQMMKKGSGVDKATINKTRKFLASAEKMADHVEGAKSWSNVGNSIRTVPGKLAKANISHTVMNGAFVAESAVSMASDALNAKSQIRMLKELCADMTGQKVENISTARVLFGSVPEPVRVGRSSLVKQMLMKEGADLANVVINTKQALNSKFSMAKSLIGFMGAQAVSHAADNLVADHTAEMYVAFKQAFLAAKASGQELSAEQYTQFIGAVSPELARRGGAKGRFAQEIGNQYAEEKISPVEIMKEISNGRVMARVHGIIDTTAKQNSSTVTHAQKISGAKSALPIVGPHTNKIVSEATQETGITR